MKRLSPKQRSILQPKINLQDRYRNAREAFELLYRREEETRVLPKSSRFLGPMFPAGVLVKKK